MNISAMEESQLSALIHQAISQALYPISGSWHDNTSPVMTLDTGSIGDMVLDSGSFDSGSIAIPIASDSGSIISSQSLDEINHKLLLSLLADFRDLSSRVKALYVKEVEKAIQLPVEMIEPVIEKRFIRKRLNRQLLEGEIREAISRSKHGTMAEAARYLEVNLATLKKYCLYYDKHHNTTVGFLPYVPLWKQSRGRKPLKRDDV